MKLDRRKVDLARARKGLSVNALARTAKVSQLTICNAEDIAPLPLGRLAKALDVDVEDLLQEE